MPGSTATMKQALSKRASTMQIAAESWMRKPAPDFILLHFVSGEEVSLNSLKGRIIYLSFYLPVMSKIVCFV
jgi:hypothetical protein